ncbi:MAG: LytTR family DNA-binding domain-containing protein, partial [Betaproteobacteria bacterium]
LVDELDPLMFWQIHRAAIVNVHAIERVTRGLRDGVLLAIRDRPELLSVSQPYAHLFRKM